MFGRGPVPPRREAGRELAGRPLYAGLSALAWPDPNDHHLTIWHGFNLLREYRGDSHNAVLVAHKIDACECHLLMAAGAVGGCACHSGFLAFGITVDVTSPPDAQIASDREWPVADRQAALQRLCERGLLRSDGTITPEGMNLHNAIERQTDEVGFSAIDSDSDSVERLAELMQEPVSLLRQHWTLTGPIAT